MRRLVMALCAAALVPLASCSPDTPMQRYECSCEATALPSAAARYYPLCESSSGDARDDAVSQCEQDLGDDAGCECSCTRAGDC